MHATLKAAVEAQGSSLRWMPRADDVAGAGSLRGLPLLVSGVDKASSSWDRELFGLRWLRGSCGDVPLEDPPGWRLEDFLAYAADPRAGTMTSAADGGGALPAGTTAAEAAASGRTLCARDVQCPLAWRDALEAALRAAPALSPRRGGSALNDLPEAVLPHVPEPLRVCVALPRTGTQPSLDLCAKCSLLAHGDAGDAHVVWVCTAPHDAGAALTCDALLALAPCDTAAFAARVARLSSSCSFPVYVAVQREGELVVLPPNAVYCCATGGGRCVSVTWDVHTPETLEIAYTAALPLLRSVGKAEVHLTKAMAYYSLARRSDPMAAKAAVASEDEDAVALREFPPLLRIVDSILQEDTLGDDEGPWQKPQPFEDPVPHLRACVNCGSSIFNRAYRCVHCVSDPADVYDEGDVCVDCVAEGKGCGHKDHIGALVLMEHISIAQCRRTLHNGVCAFKDIIGRMQNQEAGRQLLFNALLPVAKNRRSTATVAALQVKRCRLAGEGGSVICHLCQKAVHPSEVAICSMGCSTPFCARCLWDVYKVRLISTLRKKDWVCPACNRACPCPKCAPSMRAEAPADLPPPPPPPPPIGMQGIDHRLQHQQQLQQPPQRFAAPPPPPPLMAQQAQRRPRSRSRSRSVSSSRSRSPSRSRSRSPSSSRSRSPSRSRSRSPPRMLRRPGWFQRASYTRGGFNSWRGPWAQQPTQQQQQQPLPQQPPPPPPPPPPPTQSMGSGWKTVQQP